MAPWKLGRPGCRLWRAGARVFGGLECERCGGDGQYDRDAAGLRGQLEGYFCGRWHVAVPEPEFVGFSMKALFTITLLCFLVGCATKPPLEVHHEFAPFGRCLRSLSHCRQALS